MTIQKWTFYLIALAYASFFFFYLQTKNKLTSLLVAVAVFILRLNCLSVHWTCYKANIIVGFSCIFLLFLTFRNNQIVRNFSSNLFYGCNVSRLARSDNILHIFCSDDLFHLFLFQIIKNKR